MQIFRKQYMYLLPRFNKYFCTLAHWFWIFLFRNKITNKHHGLSEYPIFLSTLASARKSFPGRQHASFPGVGSTPRQVHLLVCKVLTDVS